MTFRSQNGTIIGGNKFHAPETTMKQPTRPRAAAAILRSMAFAACLAGIGGKPSAGGEEAIPRNVADGPVFSFDSTLRGWEGELVLMLGDPPSPAAPFTLRAAAAGTVEFATPFQGCRIEGRAFRETVSSVTPAAACGVLECTAANIIAGSAKPAIWLAWRHSPPGNGAGGIQGVLLGHTEGYRPKSHPAPWNEKWTWFFEGASYCRGLNRVYWIENRGGFDATRRVRLPEMPYRTIEPGTLTGFTRLEKTLASGETASFRAIVPLAPVPLEPAPKAD